MAGESAFTLVDFVVLESSGVKYTLKHVVTKRNFVESTGATYLLRL